MKENRYETDFPNRKEICNAIRYRDMKKLQDVIEKKGESSLFEREKKEGSLDPPNSLGFGNYLYSLPFFDFLLEQQIQIPESIFFPQNTFQEFFLNWALMEAHPHGEKFLKKSGEEVHD